MKTTEWYGLYSKSWQGEIVPEAFSHPAKVSFGLAERIYQHMLDSGYIRPGDHIVDPFGGIAGFAFHAMRHGLHWHGCELEPRFVELGNQNLGLWQARYSGWFANWGTAVLHQGDSRQLAQVIGTAGGCVSSPPYASGEKGHPSLGSVGRDDWGNDGRGIAARRGVSGEYGRAVGQLAAMPEGNFSAAISSPPYGDAISNETGGIDWNKAKTPRPDKARPSSNRHNTMTDGVTLYGRELGNLGNMRMDAAVSSPPFENTNLTTDAKFMAAVERDKRNGSRLQPDLGTYGTTPGNVGNATGASFWTAARDIVAQVYQVLKPGGYAAWVTGDFVRGGQRVTFGQQWLELCQAVGFEPAEWIVAWKTENHGAQLDIFGNAHSKQIDRVSFFRRLANQKNPDAAILNEDVLIVRKPEAAL